jgi:predicted nuclease of restriction endonuclease-like (RecB) superfamily
MKQFYVAYSDSAIWPQAVAKLKNRGKEGPERIPLEVLRQLVAEVPWGHHTMILNKIEAPAARLYYLRATAQFGWTRNVLLNQIKAGTYERAITEKKTHNFPVALPECLADQAEETLKSSYCLEFLGIRREVKERELEDRLIERLRDFILELGYGFCFVCRQHRLALGQKEYFIDLLFYLNLLNDKERAADDNASAGQSEGQAADRETTFRGRSRCIPSLTVETDRLDRCIESDLVAELEAIGECLLRAEKNRFAYGTYAGTNLWT